MTPGQLAMPAALVAMMTRASQLGDTISRPPASATRPTSSGVSTVPAPISAMSPWASAMRRMLAKGSGEFSGTSIRVMPASMQARATSTASSGVTPRRMAMMGRVMSGPSSGGRRR